MTSHDAIPGILDQLSAIFDESAANLRRALIAYVREGARPDPDARASGAFAYPELRIAYDPDLPPPVPARAFARLNQPGLYTASIARPALFREYLSAQLVHLLRDYQVEISVGRSASEVPYPYVLDGSEDLQLNGVASAELGRWFPTTELVHIGDEIADGMWDFAQHSARPLALFDAPRTDFSLARLRHYTGTPPAHFQRFILFTNYVRYVDEFVRFAADALRRPDTRYQGLSVPGSRYARGMLENVEA
ncbi:MAG: AMP nucleosidase [uncultured Sphingomonas sp.]|uniref:AMP nucleosidase n=1 Tax=uncultured Sphingomonas sp. TaxID=158754 RepID=A0A6J4TRY8_9SPHN|nr:MAG: AMP nucleosidase [uncultured Sphingomonas sp.]